MKLIVGLGNPGKEYEGTRHNVGFFCVDKLKEALAGAKIIFAKPDKFMNNSGPAVAKILRYHKIKPSDLLVIHDDKDIPLGEYKIQTGRGSAGHKGAQSIIDALDTKDFTRLRVGIAPTDKEIKNTSDFVLKKFSKKEKEIINQVSNEIVERIKSQI
ncbi:peptidyl-tRNA hydrolase [Patescibacteria group bacterium]|nr:MAG: peptidyl-tRNA hydrolase [Patescibacteria group bacterium]